jgi:hypothetical protein
MICGNNNNKLLPNKAIVCLLVHKILIETWINYHTNGWLHQIYCLAAISILEATNLELFATVYIELSIKHQVNSLSNILFYYHSTLPSFFLIYH